MQFGIQNTIIPPAPSVNTVDFNTIALVGIAPKGPAQTLVVCGSDTDDSQFGSCLTGFNIPRALSVIRQSGGGKVVVVNVFNETDHTTQVTNENATVTAQKTKSAYNPTNEVVVKNTPVDAVAAVAASATLIVTTGSALNDTINISVGLVDLIPGGIDSAGGTATQTAQEIVDAINANTGDTGFSATKQSGGNFTIIAPLSAGATVNAVVSTLTLTGTVAIGTNNAFANGVTEVIAVPLVTYVENTDYTIDVYGNITFLISITDATVVRLTYKKLNAAAITSSVIIGEVGGATRTGCKLIDSCKTLLGLVPKILIIPGYNTLAPVQIEMERLSAKYRMRSFYASTTGMTQAQAISSRGPSGPLATFNTATKRGILLFPKVKTYDPQTATLTLDDPSAAFAGFLSWNAAVNGPHVSPSNQIMPALGGTEINLLHDWEDPNSAADTNQLRNAGIVCAFSETGWKWWGGENASFPSNTAVDNNLTCIYVNDVITDALTQFAVQYVDTNITEGSISSALNAMNDYYGTLKTKQWIGLSSRVRFLPERNPKGDLALGKIKFTRNTFYFVGMKLIEIEENQEVQLPNFTN